MSNLRVLLKGLEPGMVILQQPGEDNGQWESMPQRVDGVLIGRLQVLYARKRMMKKKMTAVLVGGTPRVLKEVSRSLCLVAVWPARKVPPAPAIEDQNLCALLKRLKMPIYDWTIVKIERDVS